MLCNSAQCVVSDANETQQMLKFKFWGTLLFERFYFLKARINLVEQSHYKSAIITVKMISNFIKDYLKFRINILLSCTLHRGAFCQFPFRWIYYGSNKSRISKTHLCALGWFTKVPSCGRGRMFVDLICKAWRTEVPHSNLALTELTEFINKITKNPEIHGRVRWKKFQGTSVGTSL